MSILYFLDLNSTPQINRTKTESIRSEYFEVKDIHSSSSFFSLKFNSMFANNLTMTGYPSGTGF